MDALLPAFANLRRGVVPATAMRNPTVLALAALLTACGGLPNPSPGGNSPSITAAAASALTGTWQAAPGYGITEMDTGNALGENAFIGYSGWHITPSEAQSWVTALYNSRLRALGVRYLYAVQGPLDSDYHSQEIGNSRLIPELLARVGPSTSSILVAGHSSGAFVANEILEMLATGYDPSGVTAGKLVYFDLDGGLLFLDGTGINYLRRLYFVTAYDRPTNTYSSIYNDMVSLAAQYQSKGGLFVNNSDASGCLAGARGCVHMTLVNSRPHNPRSASGIDYADFQGRGVDPQWLDGLAADARLGQCGTTFSTTGAIEAHYVSLGGCQSFLGVPSSGDTTASDGVGHFNFFAQGGSIYWTPSTGAVSVRGVIRTRWASMGWQTGVLGYPTKDEYAVPVGRRSDFQHGSITFNATTGQTTVTLH